MSTVYKVQEIVTFMQTIQDEYIDGYNRLDTDELLQVTLHELGERGEREIPPEFAIAARRVAALWREANR